jgi:glycosyltransferase involved in cell wall biosynthesis
MRFSLIIPCYNESGNLPELAERCAQLAAAAQGEVILVDNGSSDATRDLMPGILARAVGCRSVRVEVNQGYGFGILAGLREAKGSIIGWTHADLQTDPMDVMRGLDLFDKAKRPEKLFVKGQRQARPFGDRIFTFGMTMFETMLLGDVFSDVNAQPTLFSRSFFETWESPPHDFSLDLFAYVSAKRAGFKVRRFPVRFGERKHGKSSWNVSWRSKYKFIKRTLGYSFRLRDELSDRADAMYDAMYRDE